MSPRKALTSLAALALVSTAVLSVPAIAQADVDDAGGDDTLWFAAWGLAGTAILATILSTHHDHEEQENPPVSP